MPDLTPIEVVHETRRTVDRWMADPEMHQTLVDRKPNYLEILPIMARAQRECDNHELAVLCMDTHARLDFWRGPGEDDDGERIEAHDLPPLPAGFVGFWGP